MIKPEFWDNMRVLLGEEFPSFREAMERPPQRGLRVNPAKISGAEFAKLAPSSFKLAPCPFSPHGFVLEGGAHPGAHPYHHAGLYYLTEPSAMCAASALIPHAKKRVLDLCAAPGGKSAALAAALGGDGILVSNEIVFSRAKVLSKNLERIGAANAMVTGNAPSELAEIFPGWFDAVLVDAPCSGEGMFRKDPDAARAWTPESPASCALRQYAILRSAAACLKVGGYLLYSTCTFNREENEGVLRRFLASHPFEAIPISFPGARNGLDGLPAARIYPHLSPGEGHFVCLMRKVGGEENACDFPPPYFAPPPALKREFGAFLQDFAVSPLQGTLRAHESGLYLVPEGMPYHPRLNLLRAGVRAAEIAGGRLIPQHGLALALPKGAAVRTYDYPADSREIAAYLHGESLPRENSERGWCVVAADGFALGLAKAADGLLKNHYPKGLRN